MQTKASSASYITLAWLAAYHSTKQTSVSRHTTRARTHHSREQRRPCYACASSAHMGEAASTAAASASLLATAAVRDDEERYVKVASRFFRVKPAAGGGSVVGRPPAHRRHHFLDSCFLCKSSISHDRDIFMYKGDAAFCSEECRQEQVAMDEGLQAAARRRHKQDTAERAAGAARTVMRRRPTIAADLGAVARTPVAAS